MTSRSEMENPREAPETAKPDRERPGIEDAEPSPEAVAAEADKAAEDFASQEAAIEEFGGSEIARVAEESGLAQEELEGIRDFRSARKEIEDVAKEGRGIVGSFKDRLSGIKARAKRLGRAIVAGAVLSGSVMNVAEAAEPPARGPAVEHVEKGRGAPAWNEVVDATEAAVMADKDLAAERGESGRKEFLDVLKSWDQEQVRRDAADLAGVDVGALGHDGFKNVEVWSEAKFMKERNRDLIPMPVTMDALAENDEIAFRASRFLDAGGHVDAGKVKKGATHEFMHVVTTVERPGHSKQERLWDGAGVSHELNEGVTELLALRVAQKEGVKLENHQAYAGGDLVAARLLESLVGQKALFADYVEGKTDRIKAALDAKLGKGAAERILSRRVDVGQEGDALVAIMEMSRAGVDVAALWSEAKAEGFLDDVRVAPDGKSVSVSRDLGGKEVLVNSVVDEGVPVAPGMPDMRVFVSTHKGGRKYDDANVRAAAEGVQRVSSLVERTSAGFKAELDGLAEEYRKAQRAGDAAKLKELDPPSAMPRLYRELLPDRVREAKADAIRRGVDLADPNVFFNTYSGFSELQKAYADAATPEAKASARAALEAANEAAARDAAQRIRLENVTPPIPPGAK